MIEGFDVLKAATFLTSQMYKPQVKLFIESTKPVGAKYYISSASCLASSAIRKYDLAMSNECIAKIKSLKTQFNKTITSYWKPVFHPRVSNSIGITYEELGTTENQWTTASDGIPIVCNNSTSGTITCSTQNYANRAMFHALHQLQNYWNGSDSALATAQACWQRALSFWDGKGFMDQIQTHYDSYKTGLGLYCLNFPELKSVGSFELRPDLVPVIQNQTNGGIYGRYEYDSNNDTFFVENTYENTEATAIFILAA